MFEGEWRSSFVLPLWILRPCCQRKVFFQEFTCYQMAFESYSRQKPTGSRWPCWRACVLICKKGHVFLAEFKGAEAGSHPGGISWLEVNSDTPLCSFLTIFLVQKPSRRAGCLHMLVRTHTECQRHVIFGSHPVWLWGPRGGEEEAGGENWKFFLVSPYQTRGFGPRTAVT